MWPVSKLDAYERNPREHPASQIREIAASIERYGWTTPILASPEGEVISGHGRLLAAEKLGIPEVPVIVLKDLSDSDIRSLRIADNRLSDLGQWDFSALAKELENIEDAIPGFSEKERQTLGSKLVESLEKTAEEDARAETSEDLDDGYVDEVVCHHCGHVFVYAPPEPGGKEDG